MLQQQSGWRGPFWGTSHSSRVSSARQSQQQHECIRYDIKPAPTATVWLWGMEQDVTLHLHSLEMPLCSSLSSPSLRALDQSSLAHPSHTGREKGCVLWPEEGGKLPHPAGLLSCFPELFLPCPRCDPRAALRVPTARAVGHAPGAGGLCRACLAAEMGDNGPWAQPDQRPLAGVKLGDQQQNQGKVCCLGETTSGSSQCCPKRTREAGTATLVCLWPEDSSEEHVGLAEVLHSSAGCDHSVETQPCVRISFWEHCQVSSSAVLQRLLC